MHEFHAWGSVLTAAAALALAAIWKVIGKDVRKVIWLSDLITLLLL